MLFPLTSDAIQLTTDAVGSTDSYNQGLRINSTGLLVRAATSGGAQYSNGLLMTDSGQLIYVDATAGLPADTQWTNGLPMSDGALCVSTDAYATYSNGTPFAENGAVAAVLLP